MTLREIRDNISKIIDNERYYDIGDVDISEVLKFYGSECVLDKSFIMFLGIRKQI